MALATLPKAFTQVFEKSTKIKTNHLGVEMTNINIWVPLSLPLFCLVFLNCLQMAFVTLSRASQVVLKTLKKLEISYLGARMTKLESLIDAYASTCEFKNITMVFKH